MNYSTILFFILLHTSTFSQGYQPLGAREAAMGETGLTHTNANTYFYNPGALGGLQKLEIAVNYQNRFLLPEFSEKSFALGVPCWKGVASLGMFHSGTQDFQNIRVGAGYAMQIAKGFYLGIQGNFQSILLPNYYGRSSKMTGETGVYYIVNSKWKLGAAIFNFSNTRLSEFQDDRLTSHLRIGAQYLPNKKVAVLAELNKDLDYKKPWISIGMEYEPVESLFLRFGMGSSPSNFSAGVGYQLGRLRIDIAARFLPLLGVVPQAGLVYALPRK